MIIIGITGTLGAGKGTIVEYLVSKKKFVHYSVRKFITDEIIRRGLAVNRDTMTLVANDLRAKHGASYIVEQIFNIAKAEGRNCIIESIRTAGEIESLRSKGKFILFAVDAPVELRYQRIIKRKTETDNVSFSEFLENEKREMESDDPNHQNLYKCMQMADYVFINDGDFIELENKVSKVLSGINIK